MRDVEPFTGFFRIWRGTARLLLLGFIHDIIEDAVLAEAWALRCIILPASFRVFDYPGARGPTMRIICICFEETAERWQLVPARFKGSSLERVWPWRTIGLRVCTGSAEQHRASRTDPFVA